MRAAYYIEQLKDYNPIEKDGVVIFQVNGLPVEIYPKTGWFTGPHVKQGFGIIQLKNRIKLL